MKQIRENIKYIIIFLGLLLGKKNKKNILPSMLNSSDTNGPGRFIRNLEKGLLKRGQVKIIRNPFLGGKTLLVISSMPIFMYRLMQKVGIKVVLRIDGFSYPDLYDNVTYEVSKSRAKRNFSLTRIKTNYQIQAGLKLADWVVFQSEFSKEMSEKWLYKRPHSYSVIPNGVDIELFKPIKYNQRQKHIISVHGNFRDSDIVLCALRVFVLLNRAPHDPNFSFRIIGNTTTEIGELIEVFLSKNKALKEQTELVGKVNAEQLSNLLPESSVSLHLTSADACPNSVLESLSCGVPVVCQAYGGQSDLVGGAGVIIDSAKTYDYSNDVAGLAAQAIEDLILELDDYRVEARIRAETYYSYEIMSSRYDDVFEKVNRKKNGA